MHTIKRYRIEAVRTFPHRTVSTVANLATRFDFDCDSTTPADQHWALSCLFTSASACAN